MSKFSLRNSAAKIDIPEALKKNDSKINVNKRGYSNEPIKGKSLIDSEEKTLFLNKLKLVLACYYLLLEIKYLLRENTIIVTDLPDDLKIA
jgi:hypothetical protein